MNAVGATTGILWTAADAAKATGGVAQGVWAASGVSIDSRSVQPGDLFTALSGPNFDGHGFVADALAGGAAAAMVARQPDGIGGDAPLLTVTDTMRGLEDLGRAGRARAAARIAAVTGSVGKTSVKEALAFVLGRQGLTSYSVGSFNNQFGVPLSLARLAPDAAYGVFELGMNHAGELTPLTRMVRPHVAVITTIEPVHLEFFASLEDIARAKAEIFLGLEAGGIAVLNRDNAFFGLLADAARDAGATVVGFGRHDDADVRLLADRSDDEGLGSFADATVQGREVSYRLPLPGSHWVLNSLAVLAAANALGADVEKAAADLAELSPPRRRGERYRIRSAGMCFELIDDSYNASPAAVAASLSVLGQARPGPSGRRIAVLGDMLELGDNGPDLHRGLTAPVDANGIDLVFTVGETMRALNDALPSEKQGDWTADSASMAPIVAGAVRSGDVVLVKGSAGVAMSKVVDALKALDTSGERTAQRKIHGGAAC